MLKMSMKREKIYRYVEKLFIGDRFEFEEFCHQLTSPKIIIYFSRG